MKSCINCNDEFVPPRKDAVYCGKKCRDAAYKSRLRSRKPAKMKGLDLTGKVFGRLTVIKRTDRRYNTFVVYECICSCGNTTLANTGSLRSGSRRSCGCLEVENRTRLNKTMGDRTRVHGGWKTQAYKSWIGMKSRCNDKNNPVYGGVGIKVCQEWDESFEKFLEDMGTPPLNASIDRLDNSKGYYKDNCRWATSKMQCRNRTNNVFVNNKGVIMTMAEYAERTGMSWSGANKKSKRMGIYIGRGRMVAGGAFVKEDDV